MKAIVRTQYGSPDVLQFAEVATPAPADPRAHLHQTMAVPEQLPQITILRTR